MQNIISKLCVMATLCFFSLTSAQATPITTTLSGVPLEDGVLIYNNFNGGSVNDATLSSSPVFTLTADTYIAEIATYQKYNPTTGSTLGLSNTLTNDVYNFSANTLPPAQYDIVTHVLYATVNQWFSAGTYSVLNSESATWASNFLSSHVGFTYISSGAAPSSAEVSEPATLGLISLAMLGLVRVKRRRNTK